MIDEICLRDIALIGEAQMLPSRGLTVLTGESGSGKTAFLSGLKLLVGERGSSDMVRAGADFLEVQGRFLVPAPDGGGEFLVQRTVASDGRSRVRLNGSMATVGDVAGAVGAGVDLCGQHEHQRLMKPAEQARMLDEWMGPDLVPALDGYRRALDAAASCGRRHRELVEAGEADAARLDEARFVLRRIDAVGPRPGEYEELLAEATRMENVEGLVRAAGGAREALSGEDGSLDGLGRAISALESALALDARFSAQLQALGEAQAILEDAARDIDSLVPDSEAFDAARLGELQDRLAAFQGLMRAYGPTMDEVLARRDAAARQVDAVEHRDEALAESARALERAEADLAAAADLLSAFRRERAPLFAAEVNRVLAELEMAGAGIACDIGRLDRGSWTSVGPDRVRFSFKSGPASEPRPLNRIASGGELSRVMLAMKVVLGALDGVDTLVFDEVDAGVGGKAAVAVGRILRRLAETHQVIVVTHLPQIAVLGDVHYVVERTGGESSEAVMHEVRGPRRVREVARMLSGSLDMASLLHAEEMLENPPA